MVTAEDDPGDTIRPRLDAAGGDPKRVFQINGMRETDPKTGKATRVGSKTLGDGRRVRVAKKSGEVIDV